MIPPPTLPFIPVGPIPPERHLVLSRRLRRLDRTMRWVLEALYRWIGVAHRAGVRGILALERGRQHFEASHVDDRGNFVCCWCGTATKEGIRFELSCCREESIAWAKSKPWWNPKLEAGWR